MLLEKSGSCLQNVVWIRIYGFIWLMSSLIVYSAELSSLPWYKISLYSWSVPCLNYVFMFISRKSQRCVDVLQEWAVSGKCSLIISTFGSSNFLLGATGLLFILAQTEELVLLAKPHLRYLSASTTKLLYQEFISYNCKDPFFLPVASSHS